MVCGGLSDWMPSATREMKSLVEYHLKLTLGHCSPVPCCVASRARPGRPLGMDLVEPSEQRESAPIRASRNPPALRWEGVGAHRPGFDDISRSRALLSSRRHDGRASRRVARPSLEGHRSCSGKHRVPAISCGGAGRAVPWSYENQALTPSRTRWDLNCSARCGAGTSSRVGSRVLV